MFGFFRSVSAECSADRPCVRRSCVRSVEIKSLGTTTGCSPVKAARYPPIASLVMVLVSVTDR